MYTFTPMTESEIQASSLLEAGVYDFQVAKSTRKTSKSGNPMAELQINVWDKEGKQHLIFDYLVFSTIALNIRKLKHFCDSVGISDQYNKGAIPEELERLSGKVEIGIQDEQPKPGGGVYPKKNVVVDYVVTDKGAVKVELQVDPSLNDDLPF